MNKNNVDQLLAPLKGATFMGLDTCTDVKLAGGKKNPQQGRVQKHNVGARVIVFSKGGQTGGYGNMVNRRLAAEGAAPYEVKPRAWGERIEGTCYVEHKGEHYLEVIFQAAGNTYYTLDGVVVKRSEIEGLPEERVDEDSQGGLQDKVILRTYKLSSITGMRAFGEALAA